MLIWWTSQAEAEYVELPEDAPSYLKKEFESRFGRPGRGRLWTEANENTKVHPWPSTPFANCLGCQNGGSAGIVIFEKDAKFLKDQPGVLTDDQLRRVDYLNLPV